MEEYMEKTIPPRTGRWLKSQLIFHGLTYTKVAQKAACTPATITHFIRGRNNCERLKTALAELLGYESFESLLAAIPDGVDDCEGSK
jgi:plasmid maintenance system antidote protein VapI